MEEVLQNYNPFFFFTSFLLALVVGFLGFWWSVQKIRRQIQKLPPGPFQWPILGCLPSIGFKHRHRIFYNLSHKYGPTMHVPVGSANMIILHGPELAMEVLKTQDAQFCSRPLSMTGQYLGFDHQDSNLCPYNANWKVVRKAFSAELLSPSRLSKQAPMRQEEVLHMAKSVMQKTEKGELVNATELGDHVVTQIILRMLFGSRFGDISEKAALCGIEDFEAELREGIFLWGELNLADYFPWLARFDLQGLEARFKRLREKLEKLFELIIKEHRQHKEDVAEEDKDVVDVFLSQNLTDSQIMGIMSNTLIAGIHTTATAIEWGMAEVAANPEVMRKAEEELDGRIGRERLIDEADIPHLPYLQALCKEVLRLHPVAPMDDPHLNEDPATLAGGRYHIPPKSIILINLWALGQDPSIWNDPLHFNPDRFLGLEHINVYGGSYHLLPFSSGRRRCPAFHIATLKLQHVLGALLHAFDWSPPPGLSPSDIDLQEGDGIVAGLRTPLILSAKPRLHASAYEA